MGDAASAGDCCAATMDKPAYDDEDRGLKPRLQVPARRLHESREREQAKQQRGSRPEHDARERVRFDRRAFSPQPDRAERADGGQQHRNADDKDRQASLCVGVSGGAAFAGLHGEARPRPSCARPVVAFAVELFGRRGYGCFSRAFEKHCRDDGQSDGGDDLPDRRNERFEQRKHERFDREREHDAPCCAGERLGSGEQQVVASDDPEIPHAESDEARDGKDDGREKVLSRGKREARGADRGGEGQHVGKRPIMLAKRTGSDDEGDPNQEYAQKEEQTRVREKAEFFRRRGKARCMAGKRAPGQVHREAKGGKKGATVHAAQVDHDPFLPFPDAVQERLPWRSSAPRQDHYRRLHEEAKGDGSHINQTGGCSIACLGKFIRLR